MKNLIAAMVLLIACTPLAAAELSGELVWARVAELSVPGSGRIDKVTVKAGDAVAADQELVTLDGRMARAQLTQARAELKNTEQQRAEAQREWDRAKELFDRTVLSERELQLAEIAYISADAHFQAARAALVSAEVHLDYGRLIAPFDGWVLAVHVLPGQAITNQTHIMPLVTLAERGRMRVRVLMDAQQAAALSPTAAAEVRIDGRSFSGRVVRVALAPATESRPARYPVEVEFAVPDGSILRAGESATVLLP